MKIVMVTFFWYDGDDDNNDAYDYCLVLTRMRMRMTMMMMINIIMILTLLLMVMTYVYDDLNNHDNVMMMVMHIWMMTRVSIKMMIVTCGLIDADCLHTT